MRILYRLVTVFAGLSVTLLTKSTKFGSRYLVDILWDEIWPVLLVVRTLLYIIAETDEL